MLKTLMKPILAIINTLAVPYLEEWAAKSESPLDDLGILFLRLFCQIFADGKVNRAELFQGLKEVQNKIGDVIEYYLKSASDGNVTLLTQAMDTTRVAATEISVLSLPAVWE